MLQGYLEIQSNGVRLDRLGGLQRFRTPNAFSCRPALAAELRRKRLLFRPSGIATLKISSRCLAGPESFRPRR